MPLTTPVIDETEANRISVSLAPESYRFGPVGATCPGSGLAAGGWPGPAPGVVLAPARLPPAGLGAAGVGAGLALWAGFGAAGAGVFVAAPAWVFGEGCSTAGEAGVGVPGTSDSDPLDGVGVSAG